MRKITLLFLLTLCLVPVWLHASEKDNTCTDPHSWAEWNELLAQYPEDMEVQTLHALRVGLCLKGERGDLSVEQATTIFEHARQALIQQRQQRKQEKVEKPAF